MSRYRDLALEELAIGQDGDLIIKGTNIKCDVPEHDFLLRGLEFIQCLRTIDGTSLASGADGKVVLTAAGVRVYLETWEELFIAYEVFFEGVYNLNFGQPFRFLDVGMNTGTTALYHARNPLCSGVDAFELFPSTAARAEENLGLNPELSKKIRVHTYGLGAKDERLVLKYFPDLKGSIGTEGLPNYAYKEGAVPTSRDESVEIRAAAPAYEEMLRLKGETDFVCKLDCEGSEYEIVKSLDAAGLLPQVRFWMVEWHRRGAAELKDTFTKNGFVCLSLGEHSANHGMLYAFGRTAER